MSPAPPRGDRHLEGRLFSCDFLELEAEKLVWSLGGEQPLMQEEGAPCWRACRPAPTRCPCHSEGGGHSDTRGVARQSPESCMVGPFSENKIKHKNSKTLELWGSSVRKGSEVPRGHPCYTVHDGSPNHLKIPLLV